MMMMMMLEARNFVVVIGENLDDETRRRKTEFLKRFVNIRQRKKILVCLRCKEPVVVLYIIQCLSNVRHATRWHFFVLFYKDTDSFFFATNHLPAQQNKKIVTEKAQGNVLCKDCG